MKDIKFSCFSGLFLGQLSSWYNWKVCLQNIGEELRKTQINGLFNGCDVLLQLGCSQGYRKEEVFDFLLSQLDEKAWLKVEKVDLVELKKVFYSQYR